MWIATRLPAVTPSDDRSRRARRLAAAFNSR
ncbi:hypothetical protein SDIAM26S_05728 [Streptomyces diastaticus subsp. diastaticus]